MTFVTISHPDIEGTGMCSEEAFDLIYEEKGWQVIDGDSSSHAPNPRSDQDTAPPAPQDSEPANDSAASAPAEPPAAPAPTPVNFLES